MRGTLPALFDVNGACGNPCTGGSEFPSVHDRLAHMNRLGVRRAILWNTESVQHHALSSNRSLIEAIAACPGAQDRLFPALTLSSLTLYEQDGLKTLLKQFDAMPCRALRFANAMGRQTLMQLAPVIRKLRARKPFLIFRHDQVQAADLLEFAATFPDVPLVMTEAMWPQHVILFDLMRRCKSLHCDISWMHTFETMELMVRHFGADRLLFALGNRSHQGAAIAALARADLTAAQRRQIAHGNLDRLTGLSPSPAQECRWTSNTLWPSFLSGAPLEVDVVDAHGHLGPSSGYVMEFQEESVQLQAALRALDKTGIRTFLVSGMQAIMGDPVRGNALLEKVLRPHAGRVSGYFGFNPLYADQLTPLLDASFAGPVFQGFKTLCDYWHVPITDPRFIPMWRYAEHHRLPVLSHTWDGACDSPAMFRDLVRHHPHVSFLLGHSGGGANGRREAEAMAAEFPNVFLEWCGSFCNTCSWDETLRKISPRQVVFGTDAMAHSFDWELGRLLSLDVSDETLLPILGGNMRRILAMRRTAPGRRRASPTSPKTTPPRRKTR